MAIDGSGWWGTGWYAQGWWHTGWWAELDTPIQAPRIAIYGTVTIEPRMGYFSLGVGE